MSFAEVMREYAIHQKEVAKRIDAISKEIRFHASIGDFHVSIDSDKIGELEKTYLEKQGFQVTKYEAAESRKVYVVGWGTHDDGRTIREEGE